MITEHTYKPNIRILPDTCPTTGQFAVVWEYDHKVWANTFKWEGTTLYQFDSHDSDWKKLSNGDSFPWMNKHYPNTKFYIQT